MSAICDLLTFPKVSDAFSTFPTAIATGSGSASTSDHPRKTPRLADDSDSASASRARDAAVDDEQQKGPIVLKVVGASFCPAPLESFGDECYNTVVRFLRVFVARDSKTLPASFETVYNSCRTAVLIAGKGEGIYDNLKMILERCVGQLVDGLLTESQQGVRWIAPFVNVCDWFERRVGLLQSLLSYLDAGYLQEQKNLLNIRSLAFHIFSGRLFGSPGIAKRLRSGIQEWVDWERENRMGHELRPDVSNLLSHLVTHEQYSAAFESFYIRLTQSYYSEESVRFSTAMKSNPAGFMMHCVSRIREEAERSKEMLLALSHDLVRSTVERSLLENQVHWVASQGLPPLMETMNISALSDMYSSFVRIGHSEQILQSFKSYVLNVVRSIVGGNKPEEDKGINEDKRKRDEDMVPRLLDFKNFAGRTLNDAFVDQVVVHMHNPSSTATTSATAPGFKSVPNKNFAYALTDAFQAGFKSRKNRPAEMIAKYLDQALRKGQRDASDADFNQQLDKVLELYRFTDDKDVFRAYYHRALAKRLLTSRSASDAFETAILKRLKEKFDPEFDMGESMFKDIALSRDLVNAYRGYKAKGKGKRRARVEEDEEEDGNPKFTAMVLQQSVWPFSARKQNIDLPPHMLDQITGFTDFYKEKHQGRVLSWDHSLGNASIIAQFRTGKKELLVSLYQAAVLVLFNDAAEISYKDIKAMTSMDDPDLRRTLQSLACAKKKVLKKRPVGMDVNENDRFYYNAEFSHPRYQVRIDSIQAKETPDEARRTENGIQADRKFAIDAAIVRVMKARKERTFEQLKIDVVDAVKAHFIPDMKHFKERIDSLVEGEFLKRDEANKDLFYYVA